MKTITMFTLIALTIVLFFPAVSVAGEGASVQTKSFTVSKGGIFEIGTDGGDITVTGWDKDEVFIKADGIDENDLHRLKMTQSGNTVSVKYRSRNRWFGRGRDVRFEISVPSQFDLDMQTSGGDVKVSGPVSGRLKGSSSGGDIKIENVGGTVTMSTSGGDIRCDKVQGDAYLKTSGGDIHVGAVSGEAELATSGGDISVESTGKKLTAKTSGGDIIIGEVGAEMSASTAGGDIKIHKVAGNAIASTAGGDILLQNATGIVKVKTAGGDIRLENVTGSAEAKTAGGDIIAELIPTGNGRTRLLTAGGDVKLFIPENTRANIDAVIRVHGWWNNSVDEYSVKSDFKSSTYEKDSDADEIHATYVLNGGGEDISLETVNSNIYIRKLKK